MVDAATVLGAHGILRPAITVRAAADAGLSLAAACIVLMDETGGGRMVWGHDHSSDPTYPQGLYTFGGAVTEPAAREFVRRANAGTIGLQGIGDCQLTSLGYVNRAMALGGVWDPYANQRAGFEGLARLVAAHGVQGGFQAYNGGTSGSAASVAYGERSAAAYAGWASLLAAAPAAPAAPTAHPRPPEDAMQLPPIPLPSLPPEQSSRRFFTDTVGAPGQCVGRLWLTLFVDGPDGATASCNVYPQKPGGGTGPEHTLHAQVLTDGTHTSSSDGFQLPTGTNQAQLQWMVSPGAIGYLLPSFTPAGQ